MGPVWVTGATGAFWNFWRKGGFSGGSRPGTDNPEFQSGRRGVLMKDRLLMESWEPNRLLVASEAPGLSCPEAGPHVYVFYKQEPSASPCSRGWSSDINLLVPEDRVQSRQTFVILGRVRTVAARGSAPSCLSSSLRNRVPPRECNRQPSGRELGWDRVDPGSAPSACLCSYVVVHWPAGTHRCQVGHFDQFFSCFSIRYTD